MKKPPIPKTVQSLFKSFVSVWKEKCHAAPHLAERVRRPVKIGFAAAHSEGAVVVRWQR